MAQDPRPPFNYKGLNLNRVIDPHTGDTSFTRAVRTAGLDTLADMLAHGANINTPVGNNKETPLHLAVLRGDVEIIKFLVDQGADADAGNATGDTPLIWGLRNKACEEALNALIDAGASVNKPSGTREYPVHLAMTYESETLARKIIHLTKNPFETDAQGQTAGHVLASLGSPALISALAPLGIFGADIDHYKRTPLHRAFLRGNDDLIRDVLKHSAADAINVADSEGFTPLHLAVTDGRYDLVRDLIKRGAHLNTADTYGKMPLISAIDHNNRTMIDILLAAGTALCNFNKASRVMSPLAHAIQRNSHDTALIMQLIDNNADINAPGWQGKTPLMMALNNGNEGLAKKLLDFGADVTRVDDYGHSAIYYIRNREMLERILELGADPNAGANDDPSLVSMVRSRQFDLAHLLLKYNADPNAKDHSGMTALHHAVNHGQTLLVKALLDAGADPDLKRTHDHQTTIHIAAHAGSFECMRMLVERGVEVNTPDNSGQTPLHIATQQRNRSVIEYLLENGADPRMTDIYGQSPLEAARTTGQPAVVALFKKRIEFLENPGKFPVVPPPPSPPRYNGPYLF